MRYVCVAMVAVIAAGFVSEAQAVSAGPGGYVYWSSGAGGASKVMLYRAQVDSNWAIVGTAVNFDNVANNNTTNTGVFNRDVEVLDPRASGGTGKLLVAADYNNSPSVAPNDGRTANDVVVVDPNHPTTTYSKAAGNMFTDGKLATNTNVDWNTVGARLAVPAPQNWIGASHGISMVTEGYSAWYGNLSYIHDQDGNGLADCGTSNTAEGIMIGNAASTPAASGQPGDLEFGSDKALYSSYAPVFFGPVNIKRTWVQNGTTLQSTIYYPHDNPSDGVGNSYFNGGGNYIGAGFIATGPGYTNVRGQTNTNPIVYLFTMDCNSLPAIFAMQDSVNGDNVVSTLAGSPDTFKEIWKSGDAAGITIANSSINISDIEMVVGADGTRTLLFADINGAGSLWALSLTDNGLAVAGSGVKVLSAITGFSDRGEGFEFDANPSSVPEPMSALLLGSGALGVFGFIRRQRMK